MTTPLLATEEKMAANPLFEWRMRNGITRMRLAAAMKASVTSIALWEAAASMPSKAKLDCLSKVTGIDNLSESWRAWFNDGEGGVR